MSNEANAPRIIYEVWTGSYEDAGIVGRFDDRQLAERWAELNGGDVEEATVNEPANVEQASRSSVRWFCVTALKSPAADRPTCHYSRVESGLLHVPQLRTSPNIPDWPLIEVTVEARSKGDAILLATELFAEFRASYPAQKSAVS